MTRIRKRGETYTVEIRKGKYKYSPLVRSFKKKTVAESWAKKVELAMDTGDFIDLRTAKGYLLVDLIDRYVDEIVPTKAESTIVSDTMRLKRIKTEVGKVTLADADLHYFYAYFTGMLKNKVKRSKVGKLWSTSYVQKNIKDLINVYRVSERLWGITLPDGNAPREAMHRMSEAGLLAGANVERVSRLRDGEYEAIRRHKCEGGQVFHQMAVLLFIETGMRRSELFGMKKSLVDYRNRVYKLDRQKTDKTRTRQKTGRDVPLTTRAAAIIKIVTRLKPHGENLWPWSHVDTINQGTKSLFERLGIKDVSPHDLRHEFGSYHSDSGMDIRLVGAAMGHADLKSTKRYTHPDARKIANMFTRR